MLSSNTCTVTYHFCVYRPRDTHIHVSGMHYFMFYFWREFSLAFFTIHQTAKLKYSPKFSTIQYYDSRSFSFAKCLYYSSV